MQAFEEIEMQLWDYIDNRCNHEERSRIAALIAGNAVWKKVYDELVSANEIFKTTEAEQPSLRFTKNIMDALGTENVAPRSARYLNHRFIKGIAASIIACMSALLIYLLAIADWSLTTPVVRRRINTDWLFNTGVQQVILIIIVILGLLLADSLLRRRNMPRGKASL